MKIHSKKTKSYSKHFKQDDSDNSFLVETSLNKDIPLDIRKEIDAKFHQSKINSEYKFPRKIVIKKLKSKQPSQRNSLDKLNKIYQSHKASRSSNFGLNIERNQEILYSKKPSLNLNTPLAVKTEHRLDEDKYNYTSHRTLGELAKTNRFLKDKKLIEILIKNIVPLTSKRTKSDYPSKVTTPSNMSSNLVPKANKRLMKIYSSVKHQNLIELSNRRF